MAILDWLRSRPPTPAQVEGPVQAVDARVTARDALGSLIAWARGSHLVNWQTGAGGGDDKALTQVWQPVSAAIDRASLQAMAQHGAYRTICGRDPGAAFGRAPTILHPDPDVAAALDQRAARMGLWPLLREQAALADRDGVAGILMITADQGTPLSEPIGDGELVRLHPAQRLEMRPLGWEHDLGSPRYGHPLAVEVTLDVGGQRYRHEVHGSRVVLLRGQTPVRGGDSKTSVGDQWDGYGWPLAVWLQESLRALAVESQELVRQLQQLNLLTHTMGEVTQDALLSEEGHVAYAALLQTIRQRLSSASVQGLAPGERLERIGSQLDGLQHLHAAVMQQVSLATGQTEAEITGQPPPGLGNGDKGAAITFVPRVLAMQGRHEHAARTILERMDPRARDAEIVWADPLAPSASERAQNRSATVAADVALVTAGVITPEHAALRHRDGYLDELPPAPEQGGGQGAGGELRALIAQIVGGVEGAAPASTIAAQVTPEAPPVDPAEEVSAEGVVPATEEPKEPFPVGFVTEATGIAQLVRQGMIAPSQAQAILMGMMGVAGETAERIAPDQPAPATIAPPPIAADALAADTGDAASPTGSVLALLPDADTVEAVEALQAELAELIPGLVLVPWLHVTLLHLGEIPESAHAPLTRRVGAVLPDVARRVDGAIAVTAIGALSASPDGIPVVLHLRGEGLQRAHRELLAKLAPWVRAEQYPVYRPHLTLGYAPADADLGALDTLRPPAGINAGAAVLRTGERERLSVPMEG